MKEINSSSALITALRQTLLKQRLVFLLSGLLATAAAVIATAIALSLIANLVILPVWVKVTLLILSGVVAVFFFARYALGRLFSGTIDSVAVDLETRHPRIKGRLIAAIQFARMTDNPGYSPELMAQTEIQALKEAGGVDFNQAVKLYPVWKTGRAFAVTAVIAVIGLLLLPGLFSYSYEVYSNVTSVVAPPLGYKVVPAPGTTEWVKYRDIEIGASVFGDKLPSDARIYHRFAGGNWQETDVDLTKKRVYALEGGDSVSFAITLKQVAKSFDYYVEAGRVKTEIQQVDVVDRPRVNGIKLSIFYPDYTGLPPTTIDENNGTFSAVVGSRVNIGVQTNLPVEQAHLVFDDSSRTALQIAGRQAEASLVVDKSRSYHVRLVDRLGERNPDPIEYYITAVPDEYPSIDVLRPGFDVNLGDEMVLPLMVRIFDDYGFSSLVMKYTVISQGRPSEENVAVLHFSDRIKTEGDVELNWDMDPLHLFPGDYVSYYFELADNDRVSGPKVTKSRQYIARLPSLDEIVAESEARNQQRITKTEQLLRQGQELSDRLKNAARKLEAQNKELQQQEDWQRQKELEAIVQKNAEMIDQIEKAAQEMDKSVQELNDKALMSREVLERMAEIQKLFEEVATPEMKEAQNRLMEALQSMDPNDIREAMKDFQMSQDELLQRLDRTLALLKKMQLEQKMEAMVRQAEELARRQEEMNTETDTSDPSRLPTLSPDEQELKDALLQLKKESEQLDELARQAEMEQSPELKKFQEALENTDADQDMQQMAQSMQQQQKSEASQQGKRAHSKLMQMLDSMQQQLMAMRGGDSEAIKKAMRAALDDANYLSQNQEDLMKEAAATRAESMMLREMAESQQDLLGACNGLKNRISDLGKQSPFVAAELRMLVDQATRNMESATQNFDEKRGTQGMRYQRDAMVDLNKASMRLMESLQQQQQCEKGGMCDKNTSQLQSLCQKQNQLNQRTQQECNNPGQNPKSGEGSEQRQALQRLAGEQGAIRKSLEELNREFAGSRQILGRLDDIANEMKEVEEALAEGQTGSDLTERQVKIYSRMLEASRSLYRKDFSEQRQSKTATQEAVFLPPELSPEILNDRMELEDRLRKYLGDNYPPQYEEQIKAYFRALLQAESELIKRNKDNTPEVGE